MAWQESDALIRPVIITVNATIDLHGLKVYARERSTERQSERAVDGRVSLNARIILMKCCNKSFPSQRSEQKAFSGQQI